VEIRAPRQSAIIVDGYNIIFAWEELKEQAQHDLDAARRKLCDILSSYAGFKKCYLVLVFDGWKTKGNPGEKIAESWELTDRADGVNTIVGGTFDGMLHSDYLNAHKDEVQKGWDGERFPLLIKLIDAEADLSIQVHPDDALAGERHNGSKGKTEMWYVVQADEKAHLMSGLTRQITPEEYAAKVEDNTITDVLHDYNVAAGDVFFLPAGRIHSIGTGCFIAEIQQTSDITYRIYDFGRVGLDGKPRELHTELSKAAIDYTVLEDYKTSYEDVKNAENEIVSCEYFTTSIYDLTEKAQADVKANDSFLIVICVEGQGCLTDAAGNTVTLRQGETVLVPAETESVTFTPEGSMKLITSYIS
jgi:mannose-6-phosphate isomerase